VRNLVSACSDQQQVKAVSIRELVLPFQYKQHGDENQINLRHLRWIHTGLVITWRSSQ